MIDAAIDRLVAAYADGGLPPIRSAGNTRHILSQIAREISPLRLPEQLHRFWKRVDPSSVTVAPYPQLTQPDFALEAWRMYRDEFPDQAPRLLLPFCYESHGYLGIELEDGRGSGGVCIEWASAGGESFDVRFESLAAYIDLLATMIELRNFNTHDDRGRAFHTIDRSDGWDDAQAVRLAANPRFRGLDGRRTIRADVNDWPESWLASSGLTSVHRVARGATTTVAELLRSARAGTQANGTIRARVVSLALLSGGRRAGVDDGTAQLDLWCPTEVCTYGPRHREAFEFDVIVPPDPPALFDIGPEQREVTRLALSGDIEGAQRAAADMARKTADSQHAAYATAVRALDEDLPS